MEGGVPFSGSLHLLDDRLRPVWIVIIRFWICMIMHGAILTRHFIGAPDDAVSPLKKFYHACSTGLRPWDPSCDP